MSGPGPARRRRIAGESRRQPKVETGSPLPPTHGEMTRSARIARWWRRDRPSDLAATPSPPRSSGPGSKVVAGVAGAVALVAVVAASWLGLHTWDIGEVRSSDAERTAGQAASQSAGRAAEAILAYDYQDLDASLATATRFMTPAFTQEFTGSFDTYVRPNAPKLHAVVTSKVLGTAVVTASSSRAQIMVFVDQSTTKGTGQGGPTLALNRTTFSMVHRNGSWLVDDFASY